MRSLDTVWCRRQHAPPRSLVKRLADGAHWSGRVFEGAALLLTAMLPALLPPATLTKLIHTHYDRSYAGVRVRTETFSASCQNIHPFARSFRRVL